MQIITLIATIVGGIYFVMFNPDSPIAGFLMALMPLGWVGLFGLRFMTERKKRKVERMKEGPKEKKKFRDPSEYIKGD